MKNIIGMMLLVIGLSGLSQAVPCSPAPGGLSTCGAPEIDPASGASALALLSGAALIIRGRRKK
jgi:hypothetical protein